MKLTQFELDVLINILNDVAIEDIAKKLNRHTISVINAKKRILDKAQRGVSL